MSTAHLLPTWASASREHSRAQGVLRGPESTQWPIWSGELQLWATLDLIPEWLMGHVRGSVSCARPGAPKEGALDSTSKEHGSAKCSMLKGTRNPPNTETAALHGSGPSHHAWAAALLMVAREAAVSSHACQELALLVPDVVAKEDTPPPAPTCRPSLWHPLAFQLRLRAKFPLPSGH